MTAYEFNITIHVLAALLWLGGMLFLAVVGAPVLRRLEPPELRARLFRELGEAFRTVGWISIGVLVVTGLLNLRFRGWLRADLLSDRAFWASRPGVALAWKLGCVGMMIAIAAVHDFSLGPRASRAAKGADEALLLRRRAAWLARIQRVHRDCAGLGVRPAGPRGLKRTSRFSQSAVPATLPRGVLRAAAHPFAIPRGRSAPGRRSGP